jgi:hypothetical protein
MGQPGQRFRLRRGGGTGTSQLAVPTASWNAGAALASIALAIAFGGVDPHSVARSFLGPNWPGIAWGNGRIEADEISHRHQVRRARRRNACRRRGQGQGRPHRAFVPREVARSSSCCLRVLQEQRPETKEVTASVNNWTMRMRSRKPRRNLSTHRDPRATSCRSLRGGIKPSNCPPAIAFSDKCWLSRPSPRSSSRPSAPRVFSEALLSARRF